MSKKVGFVGVGRMGANMARRLKDQGYSVTAVYDINQEAATSLASELGAQACGRLSEVSALSDVIVTVVTNDASMRAIFLNGSDSLLQNGAGKVFINCATLSPAIHREVTAASSAAGARTIEACMASSIRQAREGSLYLMVAGDESAFRECEDLLTNLSTSMRWVPGGPGRAAEVKALVNMVMNINTAGLAEGLGLAAALGHDLKMVAEVFSQTGANSRVLVTDGDDMIAREHDCYFSAEHAAKDSGIAQGLAQEAGVSLPLNDATKAQYDRMTREGLGDLDKSGISELTFPGRHASQSQSQSQPQAKTPNSNTMSQIVPTISSGTAGPLGVLHLPRFWQKASLDAVGKLHSDYPACGGGYDQMTLDALGLDKDATLSYIKSNRPSYPQFEAWILQQKGGSLDSSKVAAHNDAVRGYIHADGTRQEILSAAGIPDTGKIRDAVNLNNLDDWTLFHKQEIA